MDEFNDPEHEKIWNFLNNHVLTRLEKLNDRIDRIILTFISISAVAIIGLILALVR